MSNLNKNLHGLLGNPTFNMGVGLLAAGANRRGPRVGFGQGLAEASQFTNQQQSQFNQLQAQRQQLSKNNVFKQIGALMSPQMSLGPVVAPIGPAPMNTPQGQQKLVSLLGQVAPEQVANSLLTKVLGQNTPPTLSRELNDFQFLQKHPELAQAYQDFRQSNQDPIAMQRQQLLTVQLQNEMQKMQQGREDKTQQLANTQLTAIQDLENLRKLADKNSSLRGTFLESGLPARGLARTALGSVQAIQDAFGIDSTAARRVNSNFDTFDKLASNLTLNSLGRFSALGALNASELQQVVRANAQIGASPDTNALIISDAIKTIVRSSQASGIQIDSPQEWLDYASGLTSEPSAAPGTPATQNTGADLVIDFSEL